MPRPEQSPRPRDLARLGLAPAALALALAGCGGVARPAIRPTLPSPAPPATLRPDEPPSDDPVAAVLLDLHNRRRADRGLPPLALSSELTAAAREHVAGMAERGKIAHRGADGSQPADRVERQGYRFVSVGENVAFGQESAERAVDGWMDSPGHRRNILGDFEQMGAARLDDDDGLPFWCVVFATPLPRLDPAEAAAELARGLDERRRAEGLPAIEADPALAAVAGDHARLMAEAGSLAPPGFSLAEAVEAAGLPPGRFAMTVSTGQARPPAVLDALLDDDASRPNLLGDADRLGVGYASDADGRPYWSLIFLEVARP